MQFNTENSSYEVGNAVYAFSHAFYVIMQMEAVTLCMSANDTSVPGVNDTQVNKFINK